MTDLSDNPAKLMQRLKKQNIYQTLRNSRKTANVNTQD